MPPRRLIIDIETSGALLEDLDEGLRQGLLKKADTPEDIDKIRRETGLNPVTGEVIAIGTFDPDVQRGTVLYQAPGELQLTTEEEGMRYVSGSEAEILRAFWDEVRGVKTVVTFNGRGFDGPFLIIRSAVHRIKPTKDLMPNRYSDDHVDLFDRLSFFSATQRRFGLDIWCRALGIPSPKDAGICGAEVGDAFRAGTAPRHSQVLRPRHPRHGRAVRRLGEIH